MKAKVKSLAEVAFDAVSRDRIWRNELPIMKQFYAALAKAVEKEVINRLKSPRK